MYTVGGKLNIRLKALRDYLNLSADAYDFSYLLPDYLESIGEIEGEELEGDYDAIIKYLESNPEIIKPFEKWIVDTQELGMYADEPGYVSFSDAKIEPYQWFVHFTDDPSGISQQGFIYGWEEYMWEGLHLTTHFTDKRRKAQPGWVFSFKALGRYGIRAANQGLYGSEAVLFQSYGVSAYHWGDEEEQVLVWGPDIKEFVPLYNSPDYGLAWHIRDHYNDRVLYESDEYSKVAKWVIANYDQYKNRIAYQIQG